MPMHLSSKLPDLSADEARRLFAGLPAPVGYHVIVRSLRYRTRPHLAAHTDFENRQIVLQLPLPFVPFEELIPHGARRRPGKGLRFVWLTEKVKFRTPREVLRFLYLHEWMHWYLKERLGKKAAAETACDRFALHNFRRRVVRVEDALAALRRKG